MLQHMIYLPLFLFFVSGAVVTLFSESIESGKKMNSLFMKVKLHQITKTQDSNESGFQRGGCAKMTKIEIFRSDFTIILEQVLIALLERLQRRSITFWIREAIQ